MRRIALAILFTIAVIGCAFPPRAEARSRVFIGGSVHFGPYYDPWYDPWYDPYYDPFYRPVYPYPYPYRRYYYVPSTTGWLWTQVEPNTAEVWVDGKLFGLVRDFDGPVNHLQLQAGEHEAQFRLPGYRTYTVGFVISPDDTTTINYGLQPLPRGPDEGYKGGQVEYGTLLLSVSPGGSEIYIDGEYRATAPVEDTEILLSVEGGSHQLRVTKDGYTDYSTDIPVDPGRKLRISVRLSR